VTPPPAHRPGLASRAAKSSALVVALLLGGELAARFAFPVPGDAVPVAELPREVLALGDAVVARGDPSLSYLLKGRDDSLGIDERGFRTLAFAAAKPAGVTRIVVLGDGTAFGVGVEAAHAWPTRVAATLEAALGISPTRHEAGFEIVSLAVPGHTAAQGEWMLRRAVAAFEPDVVLLAFGNGNELEPAIGEIGDEHRITSARLHRARTPSRLVDVTAAWFERFVSGAAAAERARVRQDATRFERCLERMAAFAREHRVVPMIVAPAARYAAGDGSVDAAAVIYRDAARRVAGIYGLGYVAAAGLDADRDAFELGSGRLGERGHALLAAEVTRVLLRDSALAILVQQRVTDLPEDPRVLAFGGAFGALRTLYRDGPAAAPGETIVRLLASAAIAGAPDPAHGCALLMLARWQEQELDATEAALASCGTLGMSDLARRSAALAALLRGATEQCRARLAGDDDAIASLLRGMSWFTSDPAQARAEFRAASASDPALGFADLWLAKSLLHAGDVAGARAYYVAGRAGLMNGIAGVGGPGGAGFALPLPDDHGAIDAFLTSEPTLFGIAQRRAFVRVLHAVHVERANFRRDDFAVLDRIVALRRGKAPAAAADAEDALAALLDRAAELPSSTLTALASRALRQSDPDVCATLSAKALARGDAPPEAHFAAAVAGKLRGESAAAIESFRAYLAAVPEDPRALYYLAELLYESDRYADARVAAETASRHWPGHAALTKLLEKIAAAESGEPRER
jgi:tetratricopeptide (TPR) repeat protein